MLLSDEESVAGLVQFIGDRLAAGRFSVNAPQTVIARSRYDHMGRLVGEDLLERRLKIGQADCGLFVFFARSELAAAKVQPFPSFVRMQIAEQGAQFRF